MSDTNVQPTLASYRDTVTGLMEAGESFAAVEHAIEDVNLPEDAKAALWLLAFSLRDSAEQAPNARTPLLASVG